MMVMVLNFKRSYREDTMTRASPRARREQETERERERERKVYGGSRPGLFSAYLALWYSVSHNKALCGVSAYARGTSCACQNEKTAKHRREPFVRSAPPYAFRELPDLRPFSPPPLGVLSNSTRAR